MSAGRVWLSQGAEVLAHDLSQPPAAGQDCDVLIVGSGYGGAVAAARLAGGANKDGKAAKVWVLERGREHLPGSFPSRFSELPGEVGYSRQDGKPARGNAEGLFDLRLGDDVNVLVGNGLGGGSLINAGVMEVPQAAVLGKNWPQALDRGALKRAYKEALAVLQARPLDSRRGLEKLDALDRTAVGLGVKVRRCRIAVSFAARPSSAGVDMQACTACGDCVTGCNQGAKGTLDTNYLPLAWRAGAKLFCGAWVERIVPPADDEGTWQVVWRFSAPARRDPDGAGFVVRARCVVLAAGSLGSTAILMRSRAAGFGLSAKLGEQFSTNGDSIAAGYRQRDEVNASADEDSEPSDPLARHVGPTITGLLRKTQDGHKVVIEDFAVPAPLRQVMGEVTATFGLLRELLREPKPHPADAGQDALAVTSSSLRYTSIYGLMGDDGAKGRLEAVATNAPASDASLRIVWTDKPALGKLYQAQAEALKSAFEDPRGPGGLLVPTPTWQPLPPEFALGGEGNAGTATTVHPLGGCPMGDDAAHGVVDVHGRIFNPAGGFYPRIAVLDGSIVPTALAINPALTIAALAECAMPQLARDFGITLCAAAAATRPLPPRLPIATRRKVPRRGTVIKLRELMAGTLEIGERAERVELELGSAGIRDVGDWLRTQQRHLDFDFAQLQGVDEASRAILWRVGLSGGMTVLSHVDPTEEQATAVAGALMELANADGGVIGSEAKFNLLLHTGRLRRIVYHFVVTQAPTASGLRVGDRLTGTKLLQFDLGESPWKQLSRVGLLVERDGRPIANGMLETDLEYFARRREALFYLADQRDQPSALADLLSLGLFVLRNVLSTQLPKFVVPKNDVQHVAERRIDRFAAHATRVDVGNGAVLWRFAGPAKGARPLLMIHGLSASGSTFAHPSLPCSAASYFAGTRDVWVLDLRSSAAIDPPRGGPFKFEDVAASDITAAVRKIVCISGQPKADVLAHCIGAAMFCMATLSDPDLHHSIGRAVLSQVGLTPKMSPYNLLRGFVAGFLQQFMTAEEIDVRPEYAIDAQGKASERSAGAGAALLDAMLATFPYEKCENHLQRATPGKDFRLVRHRADGMVGQTMQLDNIDDNTLAALDALFGWVKVRALMQTVHFARQGLLTNADGDNVFVADDRLRSRFDFPVMFVHGARNQVFHWSGSERSFRLLKEAFNEPPGEPRCFDGGRHWGDGTPRQWLLFDKYGHQDLLIGKSVATDVFRSFEKFLSAAELSAAPAAAPVVRPRCEAPWIGPMIGWTRPADGGAMDLSLLVHPGPRHVDTVAVVLVPAAQDEHGNWQADAGRARAWRIDDSANQRQAMLERVFTLRLRCAAQPLAYAVLTLHSQMAEPPVQALLLPPGDNEALVGGCALTDLAGKAVVGFLAPPQPRRAPDIEPLLLRIEPSTIRGCGDKTSTLSFALASCQYPPGLFDKQLAGASYRRLQRDLEQRIDPAPEFLLLAGDQVYLDAMANAFDTPYEEADDVARRAYESAWRLPAFRAVGARLPIYTMLDDHEVANDWQPPARAACRSTEETAALNAFERHQAKLNPGRSGSTYTYQFDHCGWPFLVLDTRSARQRRSIDGAGATHRIEAAQILADEDRNLLKKWLETHKDDPVKFIVSPSVALPLEPAGSGHVAERLGLDSWSGYPASVSFLLDAIKAARANNVVILSGDAHLSLACRLDLQQGDLAVYSIVSSGLYAPWPFVNSRAEDFQLDGEIKLDGVAIGALSTGCVSREAGFAVIAIGKDKEQLDVLSVEFRQAGGSTLRCAHVLGDASAIWT